MADDEQQLLTQVHRALDEGVAGLDGATRSRLAQARARALEPRHGYRRWWLPAGGAVLASVLTAVVWLGQPLPLPDNGFSGVTDLELLTANDDLELYQELEFYHWLEEEAAHAG